MMQRLLMMAEVAVVLLLMAAAEAAASVGGGRKNAICGLSGDGTMKYAWGNALDPSEAAGNCLGPEGQQYPKVLVNRLIEATYAAQDPRVRQSRARKFGVQNPLVTKEMLLQFHNQPAGVHHELLNERRKRATRVTKEEKAPPETSSSDKQKPSSSSGQIIETPAVDGTTNSTTESSTASDDATPVAEVSSSSTSSSSSCSHTAAPQIQQGTSPARLCPTRYNTTAPMFGVSLTSGRTVTIVQKFPDLLQQVVFEVCESSECDILRGECVQTYVPYLFLVIPLGPVTLTGQDYVLVEAGCVCRPKYGVHVPQTLDAYFAPPLPTEASSSNNAQKTNHTVSSIKSLP